MGLIESLLIFYLNWQTSIFIDESLGENSHLMHFGEERYHFHVACGADGAPFVKDDEATVFINSGTHITSEKEHFLLAGANC